MVDISIVRDPAPAPPSKPWYKSKRFWAFVGVLLVAVSGYVKDLDWRHLVTAALAAAGAYLQASSD